MTPGPSPSVVRPLLAARETRKPAVKHVLKLGPLQAALALPDDVTGIGTLGVIGGGLLALAALMY